jgi:hypothetical protein
VSGFSHGFSRTVTVTVCLKADTTWFSHRTRHGALHILDVPI